jgi:hypothetical protein
VFEEVRNGGCSANVTGVFSAVKNMFSPPTIVRIAVAALALGACNSRRVVRRPPAPPPVPIALDEEPPPRPPPQRPPPAAAVPPRPLPAPAPEPPAPPDEERTSSCGRGPGERYSVQGVEAGDTLNVRTDPDPRAEVLGQLPRDATGILAMGDERRIGSAIWRKVKCRKLVGWVNARFLGPEQDEAPTPEPRREPAREPPRW